MPPRLSVRQVLGRVSGDEEDDAVAAPTVLGAVRTLMARVDGMGPVLRFLGASGLYADVPGTFAWKGTGLYAYLNGDTREPVDGTHMYEARAFRNVPRPPDGWKGLPADKTNNGGELPASSASSPSRLRRVGGQISAALSRISGGGDGAGPS